MKLIHAMILAAVLAAPADAALAQLAPITLPPQPKPALMLSDGVVSLGASSKPEPAPTNRTSVARQVGPQAVVSAGYLCGLTPLSDRTPGPASTFGPVGTFLGGQLTYAFK